MGRRHIYISACIDLPILGIPATAFLVTERQGRQSGGRAQQMALFLPLSLTRALSKLTFNFSSPGPQPRSPRGGNGCAAALRHGQCPQQVACPQPGHQGHSDTYCCWDIRNIFSITMKVSSYQPTKSWCVSHLLSDCSRYKQQIDKKTAYIQTGATAEQNS